MDALAKARPNMVATLESFRDALDGLGGGLGVTDPVALGDGLSDGSGCGRLTTTLHDRKQTYHARC